MKEVLNYDHEENEAIIKELKSQEIKVNILNQEWKNQKQILIELDFLYKEEENVKNLIENAEEEGNLNEDVKKSILTALLIAAGIEIAAGG